MAPLQMSPSLATAPATTPVQGTPTHTQGDADAWARAMAAATGTPAGQPPAQPQNQADPAAPESPPASAGDAKTAGRGSQKAGQPNTSPTPRNTHAQKASRDDRRHDATTVGAVVLAVGTAPVPAITTVIAPRGNTAAQAGHSHAAVTGTALHPASTLEKAQAPDRTPANAQVSRGDASVVPPPKAKASTATASSAASVDPQTGVPSKAAAGNPAPIPGSASVATTSMPPADATHRIGTTSTSKAQPAATAPALPTLSAAKKDPQLLGAPQTQTAAAAFGVLPQATPNALLAQPTSAAAAAPTSSAASSANAQTLGSAIANLHQSGLNTATVQLTPPSLGSVQVQIQVAASHTASVTFTVAQPAAAQAVQASLPLLSQALLQHGITLAQANVSTGDGGAAAWGGGQPGSGGQQSPYAQPWQGALVGSGRRGRETTEVVMPKGVRAYA